MMSTEAMNLLTMFAVLTPGLVAKPVPVSPTLYGDLDRDFAGFKGHILVSAHEFSADWASWECHPAGDEIVLLLAGRATLVLETPDGEQQVTLEEPGSYVIVPRGTWHTARVNSRTRLLFITPGEGTANRD